jgi:hypothetical protein
MMNVAADHTVETTPLSLRRGGFFECFDIGNGPPNAALEVAIRTNSRGRNAIGTNSAGD